MKRGRKGAYTSHQWSGDQRKYILREIPVMACELMAATKTKQANQGGNPMDVHTCANKHSTSKWMPLRHEYQIA